MSKLKGDITAGVCSENHLHKVNQKLNKLNSELVRDDEHSNLQECVHSYENSVEVQKVDTKCCCVM